MREVKDADIRKKLPRRLFAVVYLRSLTLQASWNPQRMQNLGILAILLPWIRDQRVDTADRRQFCRRYYGFFNTNPYLANFVIGGLLRLEGDARAAGEQPGEMLGKFRDSLGRAFASLGDQLFWLGIKPGLILLACLFSFWGHAWAVLTVFFVFSAAQLELRRFALGVGHRLGLDIVDLLSRPIWHEVIRWTKTAGMALTGLVGGLYFARLHATRVELSTTVLILCVVLGISLPIVLRKRLPGEGILPVALLLALGLTFVI